MARPRISDEQKKREGELLLRYINARKKVEPGLTRESLGAEVGVTQGNVSQWVTGRTSIPDKTLMWLGGRLDFDPFEVRPSLQEYGISPSSPEERQAQIEKVVKVLSSCSDEDFSRMMSVIAALFPGVEISRP